MEDVAQMERYVNINKRIAISTMSSQSNRLDFVIWATAIAEACAPRQLALAVSAIPRPGHGVPGGEARKNDRLCARVSLAIPPFAAPLAKEVLMAVSPSRSAAIPGPGALPVIGQRGNLMQFFRDPVA